MLEKDASQPATTQNTELMLPNLVFLKMVSSSGRAQCEEIEKDNGDDS